MKRASEKQLTQLSAAQSDDEENGDDAQGTWKAAPPEVLAQRRIVKAHRPSSSADGKQSANPLANVSLVPPPAGAAPAGAPAAAGGCTWSLSAKQPFSFAIPPMPTSKPQPPPAACASGFFSAPSGCSWGSGGGGFGGVASGGGFASVGSAAPSFSALSKAAAPAAADASPFNALAGPTAFPTLVGGGRKAGSVGGEGGGAGGADGDEEAEAEGEDPTAHEVPIISEPKLPIVAVVTGEEDEACVHKVRAKVFVLEPIPTAPAPAGSGGPIAGGPEAGPTSPAGGGDEKADGAKEAGGEAAGGAAGGSRWVERGVGALHLNVHRPLPSPDAPPFVPGAAAHVVGDVKAKTRPPRLVMRVEHVGRLILNTPLLPGMPPPSKVSETSIRIHSLGNALGENVDATPPPAFQCLLRVKTASEAEALMQALTHALEAAAPATSKG